MLRRQGNLFVVSGPSGAGKGSIIQALKNIRSDFWVSVSATSRAPRAGEIDGESYFFKPVEEFKALIAAGEFLEWAEVFENYYGTLKQPVTDALAEGIDVILEIDIQGALQIKQLYDEAIYVFILPPSLQELRNRIVHRGSETTETMNIRLNKALLEISYIEKYDYFIINDDLEQSVASLEAIILAERSRVGQDVVAMFLPDDTN